MKKYTRLILLVIPTILFFSCAQKKKNNTGTIPGYPAAQLTDSIREQFTNLVNNSYSNNDSGMVAMAIYLQRGNERLVDTNYFFSNNNMPLPNDSTIFQMGSVTKTFTAALIARLVNIGKMKLDMPAQNYLQPGENIPVPRLPDHFNGQPATITLGNLATMNAGLARNAPIQLSTNTTPYLFAFNHLDKDSSLLFKPGSTCNLYSNLGFGILGLAACLQAYPHSATYYNNYENLVVDSLITPLLMHDTRITLDANQMSRRAKPYGANELPTSYDNPNWPFNYAAGALYSTLRDMRLYAKEMAGQGNYLTQRDIDTLLTLRGYVYKDTCQVQHGHPAAGQAMAWVITEDMKGSNDTTFTRYSKDGGLGGFSTFITFSTPTINNIQYKAWVVLWANRKDFPVQSNAARIMQLVYDLAK
ncbi:MAG: serine hydrolase domain-containing protein [Ferruginibacter sp.]